MTTQEMLTQHKKLMDEAQRLEPSVMVTERNWSALLEMQEEVWAALNADNKVSLYANVNGEVKLFNKNSGD